MFSLALATSTTSSHAPQSLPPLTINDGDLWLITGLYGEREKTRKEWIEAYRFTVILLQNVSNPQHPLCKMALAICKRHALDDTPRLGTA